MKILIILAIFAQTNLWAMGGNPPTVPPAPPVERPSTVDGSIHFSPAKNYTKDELEVLGIAETLANNLVRTKCFADFMEKRNLIQTEGRTASQVVDHIKSTSLTIPVVMYYANNNVVGYRQPPALTIYTNRKFHAGSTACARGSNLTHEWSHSLGYGHDYNATKSRPRSVPYSINGAFAACCSCKGIRDCKLLD